MEQCIHSLTGLGLPVNRGYFKMFDVLTLTGKAGGESTLCHLLHEGKYCVLQQGELHL